jgi:hypothetical protein
MHGLRLLLQPRHTLSQIVLIIKLTNMEHEEFVEEVAMVEDPEVIKALTRPFIVSVLGVLEDGKDKPTFIRNYTPTPDDLKRNPRLTSGDYLVIEFVAKPQAGDRFASRLRAGAVKVDLVNAGTPEFGVYAKDVLDGAGTVQSLTSDSQPSFVLKETTNYILKRYKCTPSRIQLKDGTYQKSSYTVVTGDKKTIEERETIVNNFSILFHPSDYADKALRAEIIAREKAKVEMFPVPGAPKVVAPVKPGDTAVTKEEAPE